MLRKFIFCSLAFAFVIISITGCVTTMGRKINQNAFQKIEKGVSTKEDVLKLLGSPNQDQESEDGTAVFVYKYSSVSSGIYGIGAGADSQSATIRFDAKGIVVAKSNATGDTGGTGVGGGGIK